MYTLVFRSNLLACLGILFTLLLQLGSALCSANITVDNDNSNIEYNGNWEFEDRETALDGSVAVTETPGSFFTFEFEGMQTSSSI